MRKKKLPQFKYDLFVKKKKKTIKIIKNETLLCTGRKECLQHVIKFKNKLQTLDNKNLKKLQNDMAAYFVV